MDAQTVDAADAIMASIANPNAQSVNHPASNSGNQSDATAPASGQPDAGVTSGTVEPGQSNQNEPGKNAQSADGKSGQQTDGGSSQPQDAADALDLSSVGSELGLAPEQPETLEDMKRRYEASSREVRRIMSERDAWAETLKETGLKIVHVGEGKYALAPSEEYTKEFDIEKGINLDTLLKPLTEEQKESFITDPDGTFARLAKGVAKKVGLELLAKRPPVKADNATQVITEAEADECYEAFLGAKSLDGTTSKYPDADKPHVNKLMGQIFQRDNSAGMQALREASRTSKAMQMAALELCYYKAAYGIAKAKAKASAVSAHATQQENKNKQQPVIATGTSGQAPMNVQSAAVTAEDAVMQSIAKARP